MPSGYTADLYEGKEISFRDFVLKCARGMGAAIMLRDHDLDVVPTPENVMSSSYSSKRLLETRAELERWKTMSPRVVEAETEQYNIEQQKDYAEAVEKDARIRAAYEAMLQQVQAWEPPSEDHVGLKEFMVDQLQQSIKFDCGTGVDERWYATRTPDEHRAVRIESLTREVIRLEEDAAKERERNEGRSAWVQALYESLPPEAD